MMMMILENDPIYQAISAMPVAVWVVLGVAVYFFGAGAMVGFWEAAGWSAGDAELDSLAIFFWPITACLLVCYYTAYFGYWIVSESAKPPKSEDFGPEKSASGKREAGRA